MPSFILQSMAPQTIATPKKTDRLGRTPPLQSGDTLSRAEFEQRYRAMPDTKAELIEGVVYMASPVFLPHAKVHALAQTWLGTYVVMNNALEMADNVSLRLGDMNELQPDICAWRTDREPSEHSGEEGYLEITPDLVIEVAASSASHDLHNKRIIYQRFGVPEYIVFAVYEQETHWWTLDERLYKPVLPDQRAIFRSSVFPGLWLSATDFWQPNGQALLAVLQEGMNTVNNS